MPKLTKKQQIQMLNQFRIDTGNFLKDDKVYIKPNKSGKYKKQVSTAPNQNRADGGTIFQGQQVTENSDQDAQYEEIKSSLAHSSLKESAQINSNKNSPLIQYDKQKIPLQAPSNQRNKNILNNQNRISKSKQEKITDQSPREQIKKEYRSTTKDLAPIIQQNKQLDNPKKKSDLAHLLQTKKGNKEAEQQIIQNLFPQKKKHPWSPDETQQKRNPQILQKDPKDKIQNRNLMIAQSLDLSKQINISRDQKRVFSFQKSNSGSNEMPLVSVKDSNFFYKKDFLTAQNFNPFQKRTTSLVKNPLNQISKQDQEAQLRLRSKWQELDQYQLIKTKVYKHLQNPQNSFAQNYTDLYESSLDKGSKKSTKKRVQQLLIDDSILQSNDSSNFTSNVLDTDRYISRKLQQGSLTTGTSGNTKNIIIESNIQYGNKKQQEDQFDVEGDDETLEQDILSTQNQMITDQHESFEEQQYKSNLANQNFEYLSYKIDDGRHTVFSQQNSTQNQQNENEFPYTNQNYQTKIDGLKNLRKSMGVPQVAHLSKISHQQPINKMEMASYTTTGRTAFSSNQPILSTQNDYYLVEFKQKMKKMNLEIDQAEINQQNKTDFLQRAQKKLNRKMGILQNSNEIQDPRNKLNQEILMKEKSQTNMKYQMLQQRLEIYLKKLKEFEGVLPKDKEKKSHNPQSFQSQFGQIQNFLTRLRIGLEEGCSQIFKTLYQQQSEADQRADRSHRDYTKLYDQLIDFKAKNNLDEYFEKYLNDETRKNTVQLCKEMMKDDSSEWHDQLQTYKEYLNQFQYSDTKTNLQQNWKDLSEIQKGRLTIYTELDDQTVQVLQDAEKNPPIPSQVFSAEHNKKLDELFNQGVYSTGKKVVQRLLQMYVKPTCEVGVNTESLKTLTVKYETRIAHQEDLIEKLRAEVVQITKDLNRFQKKNRDLIQSNNILQEERCIEREESEKMRESQARRDQIEEHLYKQVSVLRESLENEKLAHANTKTQYRDIAGQLTQTKAELKEAINFQKAQTLNNSDGLSQRVKLTTKIFALQSMLQKVQEKLKEQNINVISEKDLHELQELQRDPSGDQKDISIKQQKQERDMYIYDDYQQDQTANTEYYKKDSVNSLLQSPTNTKYQEGNSIKPIIKQATSKKLPLDEKPSTKKKDNQDEQSSKAKNIQFKLDQPNPNAVQNLNMNISEENAIPSVNSKVQESENSIKKSTLQQDSYNDPTSTIKRKVEEPVPQKSQVSTKKGNKVNMQNQTSNQTVAIRTDDQTVDEKIHGTSTSDENLQSARQPKYAEIHQKSTFIKQKHQIEKPQQKSKKTHIVQKSLDSKQVPGIQRDNNLGTQLQLSSSVGSQKSLSFKKKRANGENSAMDMTQEDNTIQHDQVSEEALSTNMQANFTSHKKDTEVTILGTKREKKHSPTNMNKPKTETASPMQYQKFYQKQEKPLQFNQACQTLDIAYVNFACNMFLQEIKNLKDEILWRDNEIQFQDLLGKASYIIQRIKTKAAGPNGVSGNGGMSVLQYKGMSPLNLGFLNHGVKEPREKSWHFDVSHREKKQLAAGGGETQSLSNRNKKSQINNTRQDLVLSGRGQFSPHHRSPLTPNTNKTNSYLPRENQKSQISKYDVLSTLKQQSEMVEMELGTQDLENFQKILQDKNLNKLNEFVISASEIYENRQNTRNQDQTQGDNTILNNNHEASSMNQESKFSKYRLLTPNEEEKVRRSVVEMFQQHVEQDHRIKSDYEKKRNQNVGTTDIDQKSTQKINDQEARQSVSTDQKLNQSIYNKK